MPRPTTPQVVITGSCRGLGLALARQFLSLGDDVVITARQPGVVEETVAKLQSDFPGCKVVGAVCDAGSYKDVEALANKAAAELGQIVSVLSWAGALGVAAPVATPAPLVLAPIDPLVQCPHPAPPT